MFIRGVDGFMTNLTNLEGFLDDYEEKFNIEMILQYTERIRTITEWK